MTSRNYTRPEAARIIRKLLRDLTGKGWSVRRMEPVRGYGEWLMIHARPENRLRDGCLSLELHGMLRRVLGQEDMSRFGFPVAPEARREMIAYLKTKLQERQRSKRPGRLAARPPLPLD